ncbi:hypothetical protein ACLB1R_31925 [Escherichia coli]
MDKLMPSGISGVPSEMCEANIFKALLRILGNARFHHDVAVTFIRPAAGVVGIFTFANTPPGRS